VGEKSFSGISDLALSIWSDPILSRGKMLGGGTSNVQSVRSFERDIFQHEKQTLALYFVSEHNS